MSLFGTDGIRGLSSSQLTPDFSYLIAKSLVLYLKDNSVLTGRVLLGSDPRISSARICGAIMRAFTTSEFSVDYFGIVTTPLLSFLLQSSTDYHLGIMVSASHNSFEYNGIKIFDHKGRKLSVKQENKIEQCYDLLIKKNKTSRKNNSSLNSYSPYAISKRESYRIELNNHSNGDATGDKQERINYYLNFPYRTQNSLQSTKSTSSRANDITTDNPVKAHGLYQKYIGVLNSITSTKTKFESYRIVIDCANGSASFYAPEIFRSLGEIKVINANPDGININRSCGSTHLTNLIEETKSWKGDLGVAFDGDADRCLIVTKSGRIIDGDKLLGLFALNLKEENKLTNNAIVVTVMSNLGLLNTLQEHGIKPIITQVGDRKVLEAMRTHNIILGGEQSGHIIQSRYSLTGDGIVTALSFLKILYESHLDADQLFELIPSYPQVLLNVSGVNLAKLDDPKLKARIQQLEFSELKRAGRILVRASGTEPVVRILVEAPDYESATSVANLTKELLLNEDQ